MYDDNYNDNNDNNKNKNQFYLSPTNVKSND